MTDELSPLENHLLKELESRGSSQYRELVSTTKEPEGTVSQALSRLALLGKVHRKLAWWKIGPEPVQKSEQLVPGSGRKKWTKRKPEATSSLAATAPKPLAYRLLDLLEPGMDPEDETALLRVLKLAKLKQSEGIL